MGGWGLGVWVLKAAFVNVSDLLMMNVYGCLVALVIDFFMVGLRF